MALKKSQKSLKSWTKQKWRTKSGNHRRKVQRLQVSDTCLRRLLNRSQRKSTRRPPVRSGRTQKPANSILASLRRWLLKPDDIGRNHDETMQGMPHSGQVQEGGQVYEEEGNAEARNASGHQQGEKEVLMDIQLNRFCYHPEGTLGVLEVAGEKFYSIERPWLDNAPNVSCVPTGAYEMTWRESPRFGWTWMLEEVPDRTYILIHVANFPNDVQGCIGLGTGLMGIE